MSKTHQKHPPLIRSSIRSYHRCEWAIYGSDCSTINAFYKKLVTQIQPQYTSAFVDAEHGDRKPFTKLQIGFKEFILDNNLNWNSYDDKLLNWPVDCVFINGNHYLSTRQIVIIDSRKKDSLLRRNDQLTNIDLVILKDTKEKIYDFLAEKISAETPIIRITELDKIGAFLLSKIDISIPTLKALILAGGKSKRMQTDKAKLSYHGELSHVSFIGEICNDLGLEVFVSRSESETRDHYESYKVIKDRFHDLGPFGAISSAFLNDPNSAYLVLACDLPFITKEGISALIKARRPCKFATSYKLKSQSFPEPLITIYEPKSYQRFMQFLSLGYACPRKVLINSDIETIELVDENMAFNANTPDDRTRALSQLNKLK